MSSTQHSSSSTLPRPGERAANLRRGLHRLTLAATALVVGAALATAPGPERRGQAPAAISAPDARPVVRTEVTPVAVVQVRGRPWRGHPGRKVIRYRVRSGDTASGIATRFHAWTRELLAINHRRRSKTFYLGERIRVPVVVRAARAHGHKVGAKRHGTGPQRSHRAHQKRAKSQRSPRRAQRPRGTWSNPTKARVRRVIIRTAERKGVNPRLALAIAWQESGWQHHRVVSSAGAKGAMQVMPGTGRWISLYAGRKLDLRNLRDNVTAGVTLLRILRNQVGRRKTIAAYYQGLGAVHRYGLYRETKRYVANVNAHQRALRRGERPWT